MDPLMTIQVILTTGPIFAIRIETVKVTGSENVSGIRDMVTCYDENRAVDILNPSLSVYWSVIA